MSRMTLPMTEARRTTETAPCGADVSHLRTRNGSWRLNTVVVWQGKSRIDGKPLVVFVTGLQGSNNGKTGPMLQSYILRADLPPMAARATGEDVSICGGCPHRGTTCYVRVYHAPRGIWNAWKAGNIPTVSMDELSELSRGSMVRLGSYGDPAAVPLKVWDAYTRHAEGWTGYTHQYGSPKLRDVLKYCQVSADSVAQAEEAHRAGIGSFRVRPVGGAKLPFEMDCPAPTHGVQCVDCKACSGATGRNVSIDAHGASAGKVTESRRRAVRLNMVEAWRQLLVLPVAGCSPDHRSGK
jgi:hypothetical protein